MRVRRNRDSRAAERPEREWPKVFGSDEKLTPALLDRLAERATVITTKGKSYRMRKRGVSDGPPTTSEPTPTTAKTKEAKSR